MMKRRAFLALTAASAGVSTLAFGTAASAQTAPTVLKASSPGGVLTVELGSQAAHRTDEVA